MLVNIIIFFLLLILVILISININIFIQNRRQKWKGGIGKSGPSDPNSLLAILKKENKEKFYDAYTYPVFLKRSSMIDINKALHIFLEIERPIAYAIIDGRTIISPNTSFDIYSIIDAWKNMPITAISSKSFFMYDTKLINIYYIGSVYYMSVFNKLYYINMITLLLLEANRIAHREGKNAYIILSPLFLETGDILSCYRYAISSSICDKIDSVHVYLPNIREEKIIIVNKENIKIVLHIENGPISDNNSDLLSTLSTLSTDKTPFYSKSVIVRQYITEGIAHSGNLYWTTSSLMAKRPNKYSSELVASNNSLIPLYANERTNPKYRSNIKQRSILFDDNNFIDWRLSYDKLQYIDNVDFVIGEKDIISIIFNILLDNDLPNANIIEQIIHYYMQYSDTFYVYTMKYCKYLFDPPTNTYLTRIEIALSQLVYYIRDRELVELYDIFYTHFSYKKDKDIKTSKEINDILNDKYPEHKQEILKLLNIIKSEIYNLKFIDQSAFSAYRESLIKKYKKYVNKIFKLFNKLIYFFKNWKRIQLANFLSYDFNIKGNSLEYIYSIFNSTDGEKLLLIMPYLLLWGQWGSRDNFFTFITRTLEGGEYPILKSIYNIYILVFIILLTDESKDAEQIAKIKTYKYIFNKFTDKDAITEYIRFIKKAEDSIENIEIIREEERIKKEERIKEAKEIENERNLDILNYLMAEVTGTNNEYSSILKDDNIDNKITTLISVFTMLLDDCKEFYDKVTYLPSILDDLNNTLKKINNLQNVDKKSELYNLVKKIYEFGIIYQQKLKSELPAKPSVSTAVSSTAKPSASTAASSTAASSSAKPSASIKSSWADEDEDGAKALGGTSITKLQEQLKTDLDAIDIQTNKILDTIDENKKTFNEKSNEFKYNGCTLNKKSKMDTKLSILGAKLSILITKKSEFDELIEIYNQHNILISKVIEYKKDKKTITDQFTKDKNKEYQEIDKNNLLKEKEKIEMERQKMEEIKEQKIEDIETPIIEMLTNIQSNKRDSAYTTSNSSNPYKDKLLTLFEWFANIPNNSVILIMNVGHMQKIPFGANAIYFVPNIPSDRYLYDGKWYLVGDIITINALKNIPNGVYYYRGNELHFD
jgi:hypothetical protein